MTIQPSGIFSYNHKQSMAIIRTKWQWLCFIAFLLFLCVFPFFATNFILGITITIYVYVIVVMGLNILTGYCGQISIAQSGFMAIGAFTTGILVSKIGISPWLALPCAGIISGLIGLIFGIPAFRVKGLYLALISLGAQFLILYIITHVKITGGITGIFIDRPVLASITFDSDQKFYYIALALAGLSCYSVKNIARTKIGRAFVAIRDNDIAAEILGINVFAYKCLAFFIGCFFAGIAGWLWAIYIGMANIDHYTLMVSVWFLAMLIIGGMGSYLGAIFGVIFVEIIREMSFSMGPFLGDLFPALGSTVGAAFPYLALGLIIILFLVFEPRGLAHRWEIIKTAYRLWPFSN